MGDTRDRVAIVVDSAASLPANAGDDPQLYVAPMQLLFEGRTYLDGRDLKPNEFYRKLRGMEEMPSTSAPSPQTYIETFRAAGEHASSVLCVTVSPRLSSSYDSALTAARQAREVLPHIEIALLDSDSAAGGEGLIAMEAWRAAKRGAGLEEVAASAREVVPRVSLLAFLDTLYYVWRGGRVPRLAYAGTSLIRIKPMFELSEGEIRNVARPRTRVRATRRLLTMMRQRVGSGPIHASVMHGDCQGDAEDLRMILEKEFQCEELFVSEFSAVMGAHTGPGLLGIAFWSEQKDQA